MAWLRVLLVLLCFNVTGFTAGYSGGGTQNEFVDSDFKVNDSADATKQISFDASNITTGTTRTITLGDYDVDFNAGLDLGTSVAQNVVTIAADDTTPDVSGGNVFLTSANTNTTAITDLDNPTVGQIVTIMGASATYSSTIANSGNFTLSGGNWIANVDESIELFVQADNDYVEIGRKTEKAYVYTGLTGNYSLASATTTKLPFSDEDEDDTGDYDPVTNYRFTASRDMFVVASASCTVQGLNDTYRIIVYIYKNGSSVAYNINRSSGTNNYSVAVSVPIKLAKDDYIEVFAYQDYSGSKTIQDNSTTYLILRELN